MRHSGGGADGKCRPGAALVAAEMLGNPAGKRVAIFCGKGNNGGDGFVIARHLHNLGARVECALAAPLEEADGPGEAGVNLRIVQKMSIPLHVAAGKGGEADAAGLEKRADLIIDALMGTGLIGRFVSRISR